MSERLREIDASPISPDGDSFLIADRSMQRRWSHPVQFGNPMFDWNEKAKTTGVMCVMTEQPEFAIQSFVGNPAMNENNPGSGDDVFNAMIYDNESEQYCIAHSAASFDEAERYILEQGPVSKPLPWLSYEDSNFMRLPAGDLLGHKGMYAEMQFRSNVTGEDGFRHLGCDVHIMDQFGQCVASSECGINSLFDLRDSPDHLNEFIKLNPHQDKNGVLHLFKNSELSQPDSIEDLREQLRGLVHKRFLKFETADEKFHLLISYDLVETHRDSHTSKCIHRGPGSPSEETLRTCGSIQLTVGTEKAYNIVVKRVEGAMTRTLSNVVLNADLLYRLLSSPEAVQEMVATARKKSPSFADNLKTGDAPCAHQLIGASMQGRLIDIEYTTSKHPKVKVMLKAMEDARKPQAEESLAP
jgi:hypothetical protein